MNPKCTGLIPILAFICFSLNAQFVELASLPEKVSNNAVVAAEANGQPFVYSFCGIDSSKAWSGIHLKAWRYDVTLNVWESLPDVPDPNGGKIAASASVVDNKIYLIGGYHVAQNGNEISSNKVHVFDPDLNDWLPDASPIPVPIDDQVQAVWRDSLIYVVTGWSNTTNVTNAQIYNPATDEWMQGTPVPNESDYRVFGAAGVIVADTIYYVGGAKPNFNFPAASVLRKGVINPDNPTEIVWSKETLIEARGYRMAAVTSNGKGYWLGGSDVTYNYNGIAYNGSGGVDPLDRITVIDPQMDNIFRVNGDMPAVMDLRGVGQISESEVIIVGGMMDDQAVTNKTWLVQLDNITNADDAEEPEFEVNIFPNPASSEINVAFPDKFLLELYDLQGSLLISKNADAFIHLSVGNLAPGVYWLDLTSEKGLRMSRKIIIQ